MAAPPLIQVNGTSFPSGYGTLPQIMDATFGNASGQWLERGVSGWSGIAMPHFSTRPLVGLVATTGGGVASFTPTVGLPVIVIRAVVYVAVKSAGAATLNVGIAADATTSASNLINACDVGTAANVAFDNISNAGVAGLSQVIMTGTQVLTVTGTASTAGLAGFLYVEFIKI